MICNSTRLIVLILTTCILISGCQNKKVQSPKYNWDSLNSWSFKGKMAINDGQNNGSGRIKWLVTDDKTQASFKAPLGQGSWEIIETKNDAKLVSSSNGDSNSETAQELISYELGWDFPWNSLQSWLRGHKSNENIQIINNPKMNISDDGWQITYTKWINTPLGLLPKKIKATKLPYSVKLVIYDWDFE